MVLETPRTPGCYDRYAGLAKALRFAAGLLLVMLPGGMVVANRSSPLLLAVAAVLAIGVVVIEGRWATMLAEVRRAILSHLGVAMLALALWAWASLAWSSSPTTSLYSLGEVFLPVASAMVLTIGLAGQCVYFSGRFLSAALAAGLVAGCLLFLLDFATGMDLHRFVGGRQQPFVLNRAALTIVVLSVPILFWFTTEWNAPRAARLLLWAAVPALAVRSQSGAAVLGAAVGFGMYLTARISRRIALGATLCGVFLAFTLAPMVGDLTFRGMPSVVHDQMAGASSRARVAIWQAFGVAVRERPLTGWGFGTSSVMAEAHGLEVLAPERRAFLGVGHPHNTALQIWAELGVVGAALACLTSALLLNSVARGPPEFLPARLALIAGTMAVAVVGHGAWQGWWIASLGASVIVFRSAAESRVVRAAAQTGATVATHYP